MLSFWSVNLSGNKDFRESSDQETSKSTQTTSKSAQTKSTQTKSTQAKPASTQTTSTSTQTKPKSTQTKPKSTTTTSAKSKSKSSPTKTTSTKTSTKPASAPKDKYAGTVAIGTQHWAPANLNVTTFRNGDTIPEAKTNQEWVAAGEAGKPAWCYYNNNPALGQKYGKLYNWYAVNDPRGLAPAGWKLPTDMDWAMLSSALGGQSIAGAKLKSSSGWVDGNDGTNESGFNGLPGGYRIENGLFRDIGSIGTWWSSTESKSLKAIDFYVILSRSLNKSDSPRQRGESVRCIKE